MLDLGVLQTVYRNVEKWPSKELYTKTYRNGNHACALGTDPYYDRNKYPKIDSWLTFIGSTSFNAFNTVTLIIAENDEFEGTPEERWEHMTKWLLDQIQSHPNYIKSATPIGNETITELVPA